jgi:integrase
MQARRRSPSGLSMPRKRNRPPTLSATARLRALCSSSHDRVWARVRKAAGLADVRIHDLRHSFASVGAAGGLSLPVIGALLGHKHAATTARYAHLSADPLRAANDAIGARIAAAMTRQVGSSKIVNLASRKA